MNRLKILIVNRSMHAISGTELYARDLARSLRKQNHLPQVFTPTPGVVSDSLAEAGIDVISDIDHLNEVPDVVHGHHAWTTMAVLARFPNTPAVFVGHDAAAWTDTPPRLRQIRCYVAVDQALYARFTRHCSIPPSRVHVIPNAIDFARFRRCAPLPERPQKALLISNYAGPLERAEVQAACDARAIQLDVVGRRFGNLDPQPEDLYAHYDLVFAKGRCLLEAAAAGAAVIYCDTLGCGPMLSNSNLDESNGILAGRDLLDSPLERKVLSLRIDDYNRDDAKRVSGRIRKTYDADHVTGQLVEIYRKAIAEHKGNWSSNESGDVQRSMASELIWWAQNAEEVFRNHRCGLVRLHSDELSPENDLNSFPGFRNGNSLSGDGWYPREKDAAGDYWWMGKKPTAWVDLEVPCTGAIHLRFDVAHVMDSELLQGVEIRVNGVRAERKFSKPQSPVGGPVIWSPIPTSIASKIGNRIRVTIKIARTVRPCELNPENRDGRRLGIAFRNIAVIPVNKSRGSREPV